MHLLLLLPLAFSAPPKDDREEQGPGVVDVVETTVDVADQLAGDHPAGTAQVAHPVEEGAARGLSRDAAARQASREAIDALSGGAKGATTAGEGAVEGAAAATHLPAGFTDDLVRSGLVADDLARGGLTVARGAEVAVVGAAAAKTGFLAKAIKGLAALLGLGAAGAAAAGAKKE
ncbi:MAG TPA: hypothetical protein PLA94_26490 [Myxococcota bacterium]|nr:hypothetical protein [Myxococcota bacterium]